MNTNAKIGIFFVAVIVAIVIIFVAVAITSPVFVAGLAGARA